MDTDGDDELNWKEFKKYFAHAEEDAFKKIDANKQLSKSWKKFLETEDFDD